MVGVDLYWLRHQWDPPDHWVLYKKEGLSNGETYIRQIVINEICEVLFIKNHRF